MKAASIKAMIESADKDNLYCSPEVKPPVDPFVYLLPTHAYAV